MQELGSHSGRELVFIRGVFSGAEQDTTRVWSSSLSEGKN